MFWRFKWFGVCFAALFVGFMYQLACWEMKGASMVHPVLVALATASMFAVMGGVRAAVQSGRENLGGAGIFSLLFGVILPMFLVHPVPGTTPVREALYVFPSWGDYLLTGIIVSNAVLALLMVFARVPKGKMLIVNGRAYYGGERPLFLPWMKYNVEKLDEISVKVEFRCAAGTSVACEAVLAPDAKRCHANGVVNVNVAHFKETAAQIVKNNICNRAEVRDVNWISAGETLDALALLNPATLQDTAAGVSFRCLRYTVIATTAKTAA